MKSWMKWAGWVALIAVLVGAINWGIVALGGNLVEWLFGVSTMTTLVYALVGISAVFSIFWFFNNKMKLNALGWIASVAVIIGGLNWLFVALSWNLVDAIFGAGSMLARIVYGIVGLAAVYTIFVMVEKNL
jgi:uncharacterized membrane protein YuzA (DUF378 family)